MGLAEIEKKIIEESEAEARKIKSRAAEEASKIEEQAKAQAVEVHEKVLREARQKAAEEKTAILVPARLAAKAKLLQEKRNILDEVFAGTAPEAREKKEIEVAKSLYG
jgi:vacuolar-type H+-ATPase subunit E/Vma4